MNGFCRWLPSSQLCDHLGSRSLLDSQTVGNGPSVFVPSTIRFSRTTWSGLIIDQLPVPLREAVVEEVAFAGSARVAVLRNGGIFGGSRYPKIHPQPKLMTMAEIPESNRLRLPAAVAHEYLSVSRSFLNRLRIRLGKLILVMSGRW